jgi:rhodanese-related sulfurtransferase
VALLLRKRGIERVRPLEGGFESWRKLGFPLQSLQPPVE